MTKIMENREKWNTQSLNDIISRHNLSLQSVVFADSPQMKSAKMELNMLHKRPYYFQEFRRSKVENTHKNIPPFNQKNLTKQMLEFHQICVQAAILRH